MEDGFLEIFFLNITIDVALHTLSESSFQILGE